MKSTNGTNKIIAMLLVWALLLSGLPMSAAAEGNSDCAHVHDGTCTYADGAPCRHEHDVECGFAKAAPCTHQHGESCGEGGTDCAHAHDAECGYADAAPCGHAEHEAGCGYAEAAPCGHQHDESCGGQTSGGLLLTLGYSVTAFDLLPPDVAARSVPLGTSMSALTLPDTLDATGVADGAQEPEEMTIPGVIWQSAPEYKPDTAGTYSFTAVLPQGYDLADGVSLPVIEITVDDTQSGPSIIFDFPLNDSNETAFYLPEKEPITEADLLAGVTAKDETGADVSVTVQDTDGLDMADPQMRGAYPNPPYIITYAAEHPVTGDVFTETRGLYITAGEGTNKPMAESTGTFDFAEGKWLDGTTPGTSATNLDKHKCWLDFGAVLYVTDGANITVTGTNTGGRRIVVADNATVNITLNQVYLSMSTQHPIGLGSLANATLTLEGENTLVTENKMAGIFVSSNATLTIVGNGSLTATGGNTSGAMGIGNYNGGGTININGGTINATSFSGGIKGSTVNISGNAKVTAKSNAQSAGISCSTINIGDSADVTAQGRNSDAGINCSGTVVIEDNANVTATGGDGYSGTDSANGGGAGIGSRGGNSDYGGNSGPGANVTIRGNANVTATGGAGAANNIIKGHSGAGIGSGGAAAAGEAGEAGTYSNTSTGTVNATAGAANGAKAGENIGKGGSYVLDVNAPIMTYGDLQIAAIHQNAENKTIELGASISGTEQLTIAKNFTLDLNGHSLTITINTSPYSYINGVKINSGITFTIMDSSVGSSGTLTVTYESDNQYPGFGAAINTTDGTLNIQSGTVNATSKNNAAGIGGGINKAGGTINISGNAIVNAKSNIGAGIGGSGASAGGNITISGNAVVTAESTKGGAGIGGGSGGVGNDAGSGAGGTITIKDNATVTATGGAGESSSLYAYGGGAGIGSGGGFYNQGSTVGKSAESGNITISGNAVVIATGGAGAGGSTQKGHSGAGIGSGGAAGLNASGLASGVNISSPNVTANAGAAGNGANTGAKIGTGGDANGAGKDIYTIAITRSGLTGLKVGNEVTASITYTLSKGTYADPITPADFNVGNLPAGLTGTVTRTSNTVVTVAITGTPTTLASVIYLTLPSSIPAVNVQNATNAITPTGTTIAISVGKGDGAEVSGQPSLSASGPHTFDKITVDAVTNAGTNGQTVEYAISETSGATPASGWQAGTTFSGLKEDTVYYVYARTAESINYSAGTAKQSEGIRTLIRPRVETAGITVTAPGTGNAPVTTASISSGTDFTVGAVTWSPAITGGKFLGSTVYTASVTLTATGDYFFSTDFSATINGQTATVSDNVENKVTLTYQFSATEAKTLAGLPVKTQPTLIYTSGETLDLSGLVLTLTYNDGSAEDVAFADFEAKGITTNPIHGTPLKVAHNLTLVEITCGGKFGMTNSLAVIKAAYTGTKSASATVKSNQITTGATLQLPALPVGASYATTGTLDGTKALISSHIVSGTMLTYSTSSQLDEISATITIPVTGAVEYEDYYVEVLITAKDKTDVSSIDFEDGSATYNGSVQTHETASFTGTPSGTGGFTYTYTTTNGELDGGKPKGAGTYTVSATYEDDTQKGTKQATFTINKKTPVAADLSYTIPTNHTYTGSAQGIATPTVASGKTGLGTVTVYYEGTGYVKNTNPPTSAGTYAVTVDIADGTNFGAATNISLGNYTIAKAVTLNISYPTAAAITYGAALSTSALTGGDTQYGSFAWTNGTMIPPAGTNSYGVTFTPSAETLSNYTTITPLTQTVSITVNKAPAPTITWPTASGVAYGEALSASTLSFTSNVYGTFAWTTPSTIPTVTNSGYEMTFTPSADTLANYETISPLTQNVGIAVTAKSASALTIDPIADVTYDTTAHMPTLTVKDGGATLVLNTDYTVAYSNNTNAGTATVIITGQGNYAGGKQTTFIINKATPAALTWPSAAGITYGAALSTSALTGGSTTGAWAWTNGTTIPPAGTNSYEVTFTPNDTANYDWSGVTLKQNVSIMVAQSNALSVTTQPSMNAKAGVSPARNYTFNMDNIALNHSDTGAKTYGAVEATDGNNILSNVVVSGNTLTYDIAAAAAVGNTATITITISSVNYTNVTATLTITVTAKDTQTIAFAAPTQTKTYGDAKFTATATPVSGNGSGAITYASDDLTVATVDATTGEVTIVGAGSANITATKAEDNDWFEATATYGLTVRQKTVTVTADDITAKVDAAQPTYTYTDSGFVGSDTFTTAPTVTCPTADMSTPGTYPIVPSGAVVSANYIISYANGTLTVDPLSTACGVTSVTSPSGAAISGTTITATVGNSVTSQLITLNVSADATWKLYSDAACTSEIASKTMTLAEGANTAYIKVTAEDGVTYQIFAVSITRAAAARTITASAGTGGTISPSGAVSVAMGGSRSFTITPNSGYRIANVLVDGVSVGAVSSYTFSNVTANHTISASFSYNGGGSNGGNGGGGSSYSPPASVNGTVVGNTLGIQYSMTGGRLTSNIAAQNLRDIVDKAYKNEDGSKTVKLDFRGVSGAAGMSSTTLTFDASKLKADEAITFIIETPFGTFIFTTEQMLKWFGGNTFGSYTLTLEKSSLKVDVKKGGVSAAWDSLAPMGRIGVPYIPKTGENTADLVVMDKNGRVLPTSVYEKGMVYADIFAPGTYKAVLLTPAAHSDTAGHWAKSYIDYVTLRGLLSGTSGTTFAPNTAITRADFLMALGKLAGVNVSSYKQSSFTDVSASSAYMPYIEWAVKNKIVTGMGGGKFAPNSPITREQMALMMANYAKVLGYELPILKTATAYADNSKISSWAKDAVTAMQKADIITGKDGNRFDPQGSATRAEAATILRRFVESVISSRDAEGWSNANNDVNKRVYYNQNGNALTGWQTIGGDRYNFGSDGVMRTGWAVIDDKRYYFDKNGKMITGKWVEIGGKWYYFNADGTLAVNTTVDGYEVGADGARK